mgnify:CR=1 FL=1
MKFGSPFIEDKSKLLAKAKPMGAVSARNSRLDIQQIDIENRAMLSKSKVEKPKFDPKRLDREKLLKDTELN